MYFVFQKNILFKINLYILFFLSINFKAWGYENIKQSYPSPNLKANEIVMIQLNAMKQNDQTNKGIEITFRFASPKNKIQTGPLSRFIMLVNNPAYSPLLNHLGSTFLDLIINGNQAIQEVIITTAKGSIKGFRFFLSLQVDDEFKDCWMTDAVMPFKIMDA